VNSWGRCLCDARDVQDTPRVARADAADHPDPLRRRPVL
jgi:hypothetical protein